MIIGVDYHPSFQQIAFVDQETGECGERRLNHSDGEAERFYRELQQRGVSVRVGNGGHGLLALVRTVTGGSRFRGVDRRYGGDQASPQAETDSIESSQVALQFIVAGNQVKYCDFRAGRGA